MKVWNMERCTPTRRDVLDELAACERINFNGPRIPSTIDHESSGDRSAPDKLMNPCPDHLVNDRG